MHSTNYRDTLILPADDCRAMAKAPDKPGSVAALQYDMLMSAPYGHTSDDLLAAVTGIRRGLSEADLPALRDELFSKGQPCLRASPLMKTHGWAAHFDGSGRIALLDPTSDEVEDLAKREDITVLRGMRSKR
ncbi:DUF6157 family protein [Wenxinia saemankumensis]|uniref:Uncharacterized protein n=1 Tax=Wenxinia saemankumensis TaxID=1447782 RepID=A0A1M6GS97_9RHOB|nr:DUF6157 family protein [Wenxinia saemankumensis]SHJ12865.1 hypothetical protein SAMN05444417_2896 [Wenxinia saemankumensis]